MSSILRKWSERPLEEANLLNPAFCGLGIEAAIIGYRESSNEDMPLPLVYLVLPIVLPKSTRSLMPRSSITSLASWITKNPLARIFLVRRIVSMNPYTREALRFGVHQKTILVKNKWELSTSLEASKLIAITRNYNGDGREVLSKARLFGKLLANSGSIATIYSLFGIEP